MAYNTFGSVPYNSNQQVVPGLVPGVDSTEYLVFADGSVTPLATNQYDIAHIGNSVHITITDSSLSTVTSFLVKRRTDLQNLRNTFYPGTNIRSQDLNTNYTQALNATQEVYDNYLDAQRGVLQGTLDANYQRITNIATPQLGGDIVNKAYADSILPNIQAINTEVENFRDETEGFRDTAQAAKDFIQGKYLGSHASAPVDSNGDYINPYTNTVLSATDNGAFYFNTTSDKVFIWEYGHPEGGWVVGIDPPIIPFTQSTESNFSSYDVDDIPPHQNGNAWPEYEISVANFPSLSFPTGADKAIVLINGIPVPSGAVIFEGLTLRLNLWDGNSNPTPPLGINNFLLQGAYDTQGRVKFTSPMPTALRDALVGSVSTPINLTIIAFGEAVFGAAGWNAANYSNGVVSLTSYSNPELNIVTEDLRPQITNGTTTTTTTVSNASVTYTQVAGTNSYVASFVLPYVAPNGFSIDSTSYQPTISFTDGTSVTANFSMEPSYISGVSFNSNYEPTFTITKHDGSTYTISPNINLRGQAATLDIDTSVDIGDTPAVTNNPGSNANARDIRLTLPRTWHISSSDPSSSDGVDGQMAYNSSTAVVFGPKTGGSWGTGFVLNHWLFTNGAPGTGDGVVGQMAYDYTNFAYYGPKTSNGWGNATHVSTDPDIGVLAGIAGDIQTLADIEDGTNATNAIQTVAGISTAVSTVSTNNANVTKVANIDTSVTAVANIDSNVSTVANINTAVSNVSGKATEIGILGADTSAGSTLRTNIGTVAGKTTEITNVSGVSTQVGVLGANTAAGTTLRNNIATVAGIDTEVTNVSGKATEVGIVGANTTAGSTLRANIGAVANNNTNINTVAGQISPTNNVSTVAGKATQIGILGADTTAGSNLRTGITTLGADSSAGITLRNNISTVAGISTQVSNVSGKATEIGILGANTTAGSTLRTDIGTVASKATQITNVSNVDGEVAILGNTTSTGTTLRNNIATVAGNNANVSTVAGISSNVTTVANNNSNVSTVAGISGNVTAVANNNSNVTTVAGQITPTNNIATVAGKAAEIANVSGVATEVGVLGAAGASQLRSDISTIGGDATLRTNIGTVAGISSDVTTVSGISSDVTTVANDGTDIGTVAGISSDVSTVAGINLDVTTVAGISGDVTTVAGISGDVSTVASSINAVDRYADEYTISIAQPTGATAGDLWYDQNANLLKYYDSSNWNQIGAAGTTYLFTTDPITDGVDFYIYDTLLSPGYKYGAEIKAVSPAAVTLDNGSSYIGSKAFTIAKTNNSSTYPAIECVPLFSADSWDVVLNKTLQNTRYGTVNFSTTQNFLDTTDTLFQMNLGGYQYCKNLQSTRAYSVSQFNAFSVNLYGGDILYMDHPYGTNPSGVLIYVRVHTKYAQHWHQTVAFKVESNHTYIFDADYKYISANWANSPAWEYVEDNDITTDWGSGEDPNNTDINWIGGSTPTLVAGEWNYIHFWCDSTSDANNAAKPYACYLGSHA